MTNVIINDGESIRDKIIKGVESLANAVVAVVVPEILPQLLT
ncbi:hypothetical protein BLA29_015245 [Euroglyphus maynei]|uniref:Uncharacterized protein n=1 Tax=Euroglyphus maynei TaxID=6958 RepID=A0A1Y3AU26_EURMA|nr:hypothetical protein BLA29_015245 [Euroglyphus maynei]